MRQKCINLIGQKFNRLLVIERAENSKDGSSRWKCKCDCGNTIIVSRTHLIHNHTKSCGCLNHDTLKRMTHNKSDTRLYSIYYKMKSRCYNTKQKGYKNYGGRGIKVCKEWLDKENGFMNFYNWAMNNGYKDNLTIDRIDVNGNYEPNNCRWATIKEQANNKRNNRYLTYNGEKHTIQEWTKIIGISRATIENRIELGLSIEKILDKTIHHNNRKIGKFDKNGNLLQTYNRIKDVEKEGFSRGNVCYTCRGKQKTSYGFIWKYL